MPTARGGRGQYHCSFCGKSQDQVRRLIACPGRCISATNAWIFAAKSSTKSRHLLHGPR